MVQKFQMAQTNSTKSNSPLKSWSKILKIFSANGDRSMSAHL